MAINTHHNSGDSSPRISFSGDLNQLEDHQKDDVEEGIIRLDKCLLSSTEFNFWVNQDQHGMHNETILSPADELFFNGVIIPTQMREKMIKVDEEITSSTTATLVREEINKSPSKSFWRFRRSSSCSSTIDHNNSNNCRKKGSIWTSLPLLLRSKSTGSSVNATTTNHHHHEEIKHNSKSMMKSSSSKNGGSLLPPYHQNNKKATCRKINSYNYNSVNNGNNNNMRNGQVLNVPPPYIAKGTSDLLGLASFFGSKDKKTRKI